MKGLLLGLLMASATLLDGAATTWEAEESLSYSALGDFERHEYQEPRVLLAAVDPTLAVQLFVKCCKVCTKGKACGNSCIRRDYQCHQPPGCACDG